MINQQKTYTFVLIIFLGVSMHSTSTFAENQNISSACLEAFAQLAGFIVVSITPEGGLVVRSHRHTSGPNDSPTDYMISTSGEISVVEIQDKPKQPTQFYLPDLNTPLRELDLGVTDRVRGTLAQNPNLTLEFLLRSTPEQLRLLGLGEESILRIRIWLVRRNRDIQVEDSPLKLESRTWPLEQIRNTYLQSIPAWSYLGSHTIGRLQRAEVLRVSDLIERDPKDFFGQTGSTLRAKLQFQLWLVAHGLDFSN